MLLSGGAKAWLMISASPCGAMAGAKMPMIATTKITNMPKAAVSGAVRNSLAISSLASAVRNSRNA